MILVVFTSLDDSGIQLGICRLSNFSQGVVLPMI